MSNMNNLQQYQLLQQQMSRNQSQQVSRTQSNTSFIPTGLGFNPINPSNTSTTGLSNTTINNSYTHSLPVSSNPSTAGTMNSPSALPTSMSNGNSNRIHQGFVNRTSMSVPVQSSTAFTNSLSVASNNTNSNSHAGFGQSFSTPATTLSHINTNQLNQQQLQMQLLFQQQQQLQQMQQRLGLTSPGSFSQTPISANNSDFKQQQLRQQLQHQKQLQQLQFQNNMPMASVISSSQLNALANQSSAPSMSNLSGSNMSLIQSVANQSLQSAPMLQQQQLQQLQQMQAWKLQQAAVMTSGNHHNNGIVNATTLPSNTPNYASALISPEQTTSIALNMMTASTSAPSHSSAAIMASTPTLGSFDSKFANSPSSSAGLVDNLAAPLFTVKSENESAIASNSGVNSSHVSGQSIVSTGTTAQSNAVAMLQYQQRLQQMQQFQQFQRMQLQQQSQFQTSQQLQQQIQAVSSTPLLQSQRLQLQQSNNATHAGSLTSTTNISTPFSASASTSVSDSSSAVNSNTLLHQQDPNVLSAFNQQQLEARRTSTSISKPAKPSSVRAQHRYIAEQRLIQQRNRMQITEQQQQSMIQQAIAKQQHNQQLVQLQQKRQQALLIQQAAQSQKRNQQSDLPPLLPSVNTYMPRLKTGETGLIHIITETKRKKSIWAEASTDEEEDDEDNDGDEGYNRRRNSKTNDKRFVGKSTIPTSVSAVSPADSLKNLQHRRKLRQTNHDYTKLNWYKLEPFCSTSELLVPIKVDFEVDGYRVCDAFTWNLNETAMTPEKFAEYMCLDLDLNIAAFGSLIAGRINAQLEDHRKIMESTDDVIPEDSRVPIKLNLKVGKMQLRDRFEWDLASSMSPERFAQIMVQDLRLGGEFAQMIAFSIREQIFRYKRSGVLDPSFAIEKPFRAEEEARGWSPSIDAYQNRTDDEDADLKGGRGLRLVVTWIIMHNRCLYYFVFIDEFDENYELLVDLDDVQVRCIFEHSI
ncbi:hypothetical protein, variant 1 [Batrachochytrium dendrobatidis JEL423]|uniref:SNF5-domain-containing protein n=1 Tax=Batrachochytrium dendrobatidis (strain JEL423) TaxID=403673 RepID=A0A177WNT2_BATDL|nr:hypothetical protein, variant 1 [Batrachochytrium dendrobatidis JEL423]